MSGEIPAPMLKAGGRRAGKTIGARQAFTVRPGKPEDVAALVAFLASHKVRFMCASLVEITGAQAVA